jgi:hypothetical protein
MKFTSFKNWLFEKFTAEGDPIKDMGIGDRTVRDPDKIEKLFNKSKKGYYLFLNDKIRLYHPDDDKTLYEYILSKLGEWDMKNADKWSEYEVVHIDKRGEEDCYSW